MQTSKPKTVKRNFRLDERTDQVLKETASELGQSPSETIRQGIMSFGEFYALRRAGKIP